MDKKKWVLLGFGLLAAGVVLGLVPGSESYSDYGVWSNAGAVDVECGSLFSRDVRADFADWAEQQEYDQEVMWGGEPAMFEGQTASQVCDNKFGDTRTAVILMLVGGAIALGIGLTRKPPVWNDGGPAPAGVPAGATPPVPATAAAVVATATTPDPEPEHQPNTDSTVPKAELADRAPEPPEPFMVMFDNGEVADLSSPLVIGRDPVPFDGAPGARLHSLSDHTRTISKTHLALIPDEDRVWVVDRNSTNGTAVLHDGDESRAEPGVRTSAVAGQVIRFGDRTLTIMRGD